MTTLYPMGYLTQLVTLEHLRDVHGKNMHPEFDHRLFPWIESMEGLIGIGDGERPNPDPVSPASEQGRSFHQRQKFASGLIVYSAVDLVAKRPGLKHRSPNWAEVSTAPRYGVHAFIGHDTPSPTDDEPWHGQPIEMRGYQAWLNAGRPDPKPFTLPTEDDMNYATVDPPDRVFDSRELGNKVDVGQVVAFDLHRPNATAVVINFTVADTEGGGFLTAWGAGNQPETSNVNWKEPGMAISNLAIVPVDHGVIRFTVAGSEAHVIVDVQGVFI